MTTHFSFILQKPSHPPTSHSQKFYSYFSMACSHLHTCVTRALPLFILLNAFPLTHLCSFLLDIIYSGPLWQTSVHFHQCPSSPWPPSPPPHLSVRVNPSLPPFFRPSSTSHVLCLAFASFTFNLWLISPFSCSPVWIYSFSSQRPFFPFYTLERPHSTTESPHLLSLLLTNMDLSPYLTFCIPLLIPGPLALSPSRLLSWSQWWLLCSLKLTLFL